MATRRKRGENAADLYCICRTPYDDQLSYIGCDQCSNWYHLDCIGVTQELADAIDTYICNVCTNKNKKRKRKSEATDNTVIDLVDIDDASTVASNKESNTLVDKLKSIQSLDANTDTTALPSVIRTVHAALHGTKSHSSSSSLRNKMRTYKSKHGRLADILILDTPFQSINNTNNSIEYYANGKIKKALTDTQIMNIPVHLLQTDGYIFMYTPLYKYNIAVQSLNNWGYTIIHEIEYIHGSEQIHSNTDDRTTTIQLNNNTSMKVPVIDIDAEESKEQETIQNNNHIERILIAQIGTEPANLHTYIAPNDTLQSSTTPYTNRPTETYHIAESMCPNGTYIQLFSYSRRKNFYNLHYEDLITEINTAVKLENELDAITEQKTDETSTVESGSMDNTTEQQSSTDKATHTDDTSKNDIVEETKEADTDTATISTVI